MPFLPPNQWHKSADGKYNIVRDGHITLKMAYGTAVDIEVLDRDYARVSIGSWNVIIASSRTESKSSPFWRIHKYKQEYRRWHLTDERLKEIVATALLHRTADDVEQMSVTVTIPSAQVTLSAVNTIRSSPLTCTRLQLHSHTSRYSFLHHPIQ